MRHTAPYRPRPAPGKVRGSDCLTDEVILEWLHGGLSEQGIEECSARLDRCAACREQVSELARGPTEPAAIQPGAGELLRPGALFGRYRIQRPLGMGGMGVVYLAQDTSLGRAVALKLLHPSIDQGRADAHTRLLRESRALSLLNHPKGIGGRKRRLRGSLSTTLESQGGGGKARILDQGRGT